MLPRPTPPEEEDEEEEEKEEEDGAERKREDAGLANSWKRPRRSAWARRRFVISCTKSAKSSYLWRVGCRGINTVVRVSE